MLATLANAFAAYSFIATLTGGLGVLALVLAFALTAYLPGWLRHALFVGGGLMIACAIYGQAERARGAAAQLALDHERALAAERDRTAAARKVAEQIAAQATRDLAAKDADTTQLKDLLNDARKRADAGRVCLPRDISRRLRNL